MSLNARDAVINLENRLRKEENSPQDKPVLKSTNNK